ncbi:multidrug effflux MFS transporter [Streptomyces sp. N2-109]|uniref:Multidrug effflux MFS transporter n=1 Tax=Streptomyces gossypii TaxID=2883101 RepID=A0ABT2JNM2_9ACTN|nr:multidrug effflux MFS transporter [Streptomyces gossypii]MCT2589485.1 multidrug effflux MFS transporter [Streptomyces gossypii]
MPLATNGDPHRAANRLTHLLTAALALLSFVVPLATDMYLPAFPEMARELRTDASGVQLTLTTFLGGLALGQLVFGPLSDRYGRRGPILAGAAVCTLATAACALAPSLTWLAVLRFLQGFSGAAGVVIGRAVVADVARGAAAARLLGLLMTLGGIAPILAPLVGGQVVEAVGWRPVFWLLGAASLVMLIGAQAGIPESLPKERRQRGGALAMVKGVREVLRDRPYVGYTLSFTFSFGMLFCWIAGSPFLLQNVLGLSVGVSAFVFSGGALIATAASATGAKLVVRYGAAALLRCGLLTVFLSTLALCVSALAGALALVPVLLLLGVVCAGFGLVIANAAALAIERVPHAAGAGSAVLGALQSALGAVVAPLVGLGGEHTAIPLFLGMAASATLALAFLRLTRHPAARTGTPAAEPA